MGKEINPADIVNPSGVADGPPSLPSIPDTPKRGRKPKAERLAENQATLDEMFTADNLRALVTLPAETAHALTGSETFLLTDEETKVLATSAATAAKYHLKSDPKWVALSLFLANVLMIYGTRTLVYYQEKRKAKANVAVKPD